MATAASEGKQDIQRQLFTACQKGTWPDVLALLDRGASLSDCDSGNRTALHHACLGNNQETAERMRTERNEVFLASLEKRSNQEETPLLLACRLGHRDLVELFFREKPPEFSMINSDPDPPLHVASLAGHVSVVRLLLQLPGRDVNLRDRCNDVPLHKAIDGNHPDVVRALVDDGAEVNCKNDLGYNALHEAVLWKRWEIMELLLQVPGLAVNAPDKCGLTPLHHACALNELACVNRLLDSGADPATTDRRHFTPLLSASSCGHVGVVESLLAKGVDVNVVNDFKDTALSLACRQGQIEVIRVLLDHAAHLHPQNAVDPLVLAKRQGRSDIVKMLMDHFETVHPA